jgi:hypothetical protein
MCDIDTAFILHSAIAVGLRHAPKNAHVDAQKRLRCRQTLEYLIDMVSLT